MDDICQLCGETILLGKDHICQETKQIAVVEEFPLQFIPPKQRGPSEFS